MRERPSLPADYVVVEGNIGVGKTTLCRRLAGLYDCELVLERFADNPFLPLFYADQDRYALMVELFFMAERHAQLSPLLRTPTLFAKPILADYLFAKTWLFARHTLRDAERDLFRRLFDELGRGLPLPRKLLFLHRPVGALLANIAERGRSYETDITAEYLTRVERTYWDYLREERRFPVEVIELGDDDLGDPNVLARVLAALHR